MSDAHRVLYAKFRGLGVLWPLSGFRERLVSVSHTHTAPCGLYSDTSQHVLEYTRILAEEEAD